MWVPRNIHNTLISQGYTVPEFGRHAGSNAGPGPASRFRCRREIAPYENRARPEVESTKAWQPLSTCACNLTCLVYFLRQTQPAQHQFDTSKQKKSHAVVFDWHFVNMGSMTASSESAAAMNSSPQSNRQEQGNTVAPVWGGGWLF
jgi:hypothetical protein